MIPTGFAVLAIAGAFFIGCFLGYAIGRGYRKEEENGN